MMFGLLWISIRIPEYQKNKTLYIKTTSQHLYLCMALGNKWWSPSAEYSSQRPCDTGWCRFFHPIHRWYIHPFDRGGSSACHSDTRLLPVCLHSNPQTHTDGPNYCHTAVLRCADFSLQNMKPRIIYTSLYTVISNLIYPIWTAIFMLQIVILKLQFTTFKKNYISIAFFYR